MRILSQMVIQVLDERPRNVERCCAHCPAQRDAKWVHEGLRKGFEEVRMDEQVPTVFLLVGLTGSGKTTYARSVLEPRGVVRVSVDEEVHRRHGRYGWTIRSGSTSIVRPRYWSGLVSVWLSW
ncbi:AAA family ATPase [Nocardiopsis alba]|uniref:AAA family ATPase n=1 Tax=Nocardiopsis alba TaxID=53437 RepID=UPI003BA391A6